MVDRLTRNIGAVGSVKMRRPPRPLHENFYDIYQKWKAGKLSTSEAARQLSVPLSSFRYRAGVYKNAAL